MVKNVTIVSFLNPFLSKPFAELHLAEISRDLGQPHPTARLYLNALEKKGVLRKNKKGRLTIYSLNWDNPLIFQYLSIAEQSKIIDASEKNLLFKELILFFNSNLNEQNTALIFGSAVKDITKANDIDILVSGKTEIHKSVDILSEKLNLDIHIINVHSLEEVSKALKSEILKQHMIIQGTEAVLKWLIAGKSSGAN